MKLEDFKALKVGQRVIVNGQMDDENFTNEAAVIIPDEHSTRGHILLRFDRARPHSSLHGLGDNEFYFYERDCANFIIEPEHRSTYLNGHSDLKQDGKFLTAWVDGEYIHLTDTKAYPALEQAQDEAHKLAEENAGSTVVVLHAVSQHTSSVKVETKAL
uniref:Uncharacterized protein n=1 Tax=Rhodopseudomonas palustris (strain DX-1) TaxID=652103 RepID=E6VLV1_RHOPX